MYTTPASVNFLVRTRVVCVWQSYYKRQWFSYFCVILYFWCNELFSGCVASLLWQATMTSVWSTTVTTMTTVWSSPTNRDLCQGWPMAFGHCWGERRQTTGYSNPPAFFSLSLLLPIFFSNWPAKALGGVTLNVHAGWVGAYLKWCCRLNNL